MPETKQPSKWAMDRMEKVVKLLSEKGNILLPTEKIDVALTLDAAREEVVKAIFDEEIDPIYVDESYLQQRVLAKLEGR